jgi:hypothetical protein
MVSSVGGRRKRAKSLAPRRRPTQLNLGGKVRPLGSDRVVWLKTLVPTVGSSWCGRVDCFVEKTVRCTRLSHWEEGYADPWLILTDLSTEAANVVWYGMRTWIESGFKDTKIAYPLLRVEIEEVERESLADLPPRLLGPASIESLDL